MSKELPYFRWFPKDAEADGRYSGMSLSELGLYHRCLNHSWINDGLPLNPEEIARQLRIPHREFSRNWPRVEVCFEKIGEKIRNGRQESERQHAITKSVKASESIKSRYERNTLLPTNVLPRAYESESESLRTTTNTEKPSGKKKPNTALVWFKEEFWESWPVKENKAAAERVAVKIPEVHRPSIIAALKNGWGLKISSMEHPIHAATWLHNRRWEDEVSTIGSRSKPPVPENLFSNYPEIK